jgi:hypothetical protein
MVTCAAVSAVCSVECDGTDLGGSMTEGSSASAAGQSDTTATDPKGHNGLTPLLIGQATAVLAGAVAVIYGAGALSLGLKLWYAKDPWAAVLGQLPRDFLLVDAFSEVIIPVIIIGACAYLIYNRIEPASAKVRRKFLRWRRILVWFLLAALLAAVPLVFLAFTTHNLLPGVIRPWWEIYVCCLVLNIVSVGFALFFLLRASLAVGMGIVALALIPCVASASASFPLPKVVLCGPDFAHVDSLGRHYAIGNLIGTDGEWVYVAETKTRSLQNSNEVIYFGSYIAVIPLSAVELESIGQDGECNDIQAPAVHSP